MATLSMTFRSDALKRDASVSVVLPFDKGFEPPYRTLYLLHGLKGTHTTWLDETRVARWAAERGLAVVMPSGQNSFYVNVGREGSVHGDFGAYIGEELVRKTRTAFPLSHRRKDTFIGGFSMGGYGALRNGLKYYETFGKIAVFAAAIHFYESTFEFARSSSGNTEGETFIFEPLEETQHSDLSPRWLADQIAARAKAEGRSVADLIPALRFTTGENDTALLAANKQLEEHLEQLGADVSFTLAHFGHDWDFINEQLPAMLDWLAE